MLLSVLLALTVIMMTARLVGALFWKLNQPAVIGEVVGGIMLGPSLLGRLAPEAAGAGAAGGGGAGPRRHRAARRDPLHVPGRPRARSAACCAAASRRRSPSRSPASSCRSRSAARWPGRLFDPLRAAGVTVRASFALFIGVSMSITAFPVLARILGDRGLQRTPIGTLALTCAAIDDVTAWCLLAFVVSVTQATPGGAIVTVGTDRALHRGDADGRPAIDGGCVARLDRIDAHRRAEPRAGARRGAAVGGRDRVHRHPRDLRRVPARRDHPARQQRRAPRAPSASKTSSASCSCRRSSRSPGSRTEIGLIADGRRTG